MAGLRAHISSCECFSFHLIDTNKYLQTASPCMSVSGKINSKMLFHTWHPKRYFVIEVFISWSNLVLLNRPYLPLPQLVESVMDQNIHQPRRNIRKYFVSLEQAVVRARARDYRYHVKFLTSISNKIHCNAPAQTGRKKTEC